MPFTEAYAIMALVRHLLPLPQGDGAEGERRDESNAQEKPVHVYGDAVRHSSVGRSACHYLLYRGAKHLRAHYARSHRDDRGGGRDRDPGFQKDAAR